MLRYQNRPPYSAFPVASWGGGGEGAASLMSGGRESCGSLEGDGLEGRSTCDVG